MDCTGGFGGSRAEEGVVRTVGGGTAKAAPRAAAAAASAPRPPAQSGFVQSGQRPGYGEGRGKEPLPGSAATGPRPRVPLPT